MLPMKLLGWLMALAAAAAVPAALKLPLKLDRQSAVTEVAPLPDPLPPLNSFEPIWKMAIRPIPPK